MEAITDTREFPIYIVINGKEKRSTMTCTYKLWFEDKKLIDVRNEFGFSCEKNSDSWAFFSKKYK